jgi:hypothetical protein
LEFTDDKEQVNKRIFLARINKKQKDEIDSAASNGSKGKYEYTERISFCWPPLEAALSYLASEFFVKEKIF